MFLSLVAILAPISVRTYSQNFKNATYGYESCNGCEVEIEHEKPTEAIINFFESNSAQKDAIRLNKINASEKIVIDGSINEEVWSRINPLPLTMFSPTYLGTPTEKSEIRIVYDEKYIYASAQFYDDEPQKIRNNSYYRDRYDWDDYFGLIIVPNKNKTESGLQFLVMPSGNREDTEIFNDANTLNYDWNSYWDAAATITDQGWFAELRIPFSELGLPNNQDSLEIGIITWRFISRKNERDIFPSLSPDRNINTPSRAQFLTLEDIKVDKPVYFTPYVLGGAGRASRLAPSGNTYEYSKTSKTDLGADLKYKVTSNLTLDLTINTDFAQAEADDQQINLTRYSLFYPEKRQFFQERSGIFSFNTANERVFHSRRIGLYQGEIVPIIAGARLTGTVGDWDLGLLNMQTARKSSLDLPSENFGIIRAKKQVFNATSYIGGIVASKLSRNAYNVVTGLDGVLNVFGDEYVIFKATESFDNNVPVDGKNAFDSGLCELQWERRNLQGWSYNGSFTRMGKDYQPEMGFTTKQNYTEFSGLLHHNNFPGKDSPFQRTMFFHLEGSVTLRNTDSSVESANVSFEPGVWFKSGTYLRAGIGYSIEDLDSLLELSPSVNIPLGRYFFYRGYVYFYSPSGNLFRSGIYLATGNFYDGWLTELGLTPTWNISPHLSLNGTYSLNLIRFNDRMQSLNAHIVRLKIVSALNIHFSLDSFIQYNSLANLFTANFRLRYNFREGNDLWIVYNHGVNTDRFNHSPPLLSVNHQEFLIKYTHTLNL